MLASTHRCAIERTTLKQISTFGKSGYRPGNLQLLRDANDDAVVARLLANCPVMRLEAGKAIPESNQAQLYIVLRGVLAVETDSNTGVADGNGSVSKVLPGESLGEQSVLDEEANLSRITALEDSDILVIESDLVWKLIDQSNVVARNLLRLLSFRIRAANAQLRTRQKLGEFYRRLSMNDGLTGLYNRAWLNDLLPKLAATAQSSGAPLALIMIDLDHFKRFNDTHGHLAGDQALRTAAQVLSGALRPTDFAVRYGGEEMMVLLPDTNGKMAVAVAERLCERMQQAVVFADMRQPMPHITASFGVATLRPQQSEQDLIASADAALYRAKELGRNQVVQEALAD